MKIEKNILDKLAQFIRQYYRNEIIKGTFWLLIVSVSAFLLFIGIDFFWQLNSLGRGVLFYTWLLVFVSVLSYQVLWPLSKILKITNGITTQQAAAIIGQHFPDVNDKLVNTVQLINEASKAHNELLIASIHQRSQVFSPLPFQKAINIKNTFALLKWSSIPLAVFLFLWIYSPQLLQDSTTRIVNYQQAFEPVAPFTTLVDYPKQVFTFEDIPVRIHLAGDFIPSEVYLNYQGVNYLCEPNEDGFYFIIKQAQMNGSFTVRAGDFNFGPFEYVVKKKPSIAAFNLHVSYPRYLNKSNETLTNLNDLQIPQGSYLTWRFQLEGEDSIYFSNDQVSLELGNPAEVKLRAMKSFPYQFVAYNQESVADTSAYFLHVINDKFPTIKANRWADSTQLEEINFTGTISDDYGFTKLLVGTKSNGVINYIDTLSISKGINQQDFFYSFQVSDFINDADVQLSFVVWDNDGVNGPKKTSSASFELKIPSKSDIQKKSTEATESLVDMMKKSIEESEQLEKDWKKFSDDLKNKKETDWQDKKRLEQLMNKQAALEDQLKKVQQQKQQKDALEKLSPSEKQELVEKQEAVNKLFEDLMSEEMKKLMEEIEKLMQELNKDELQNQLENLEMNNEQLNKELDRTLEVFKQLELEKLVKETTEQLEELAKKQEDLAKKTEEKSASPEELKKEQEKLNKEFEEIEKQLEKIEEKNEDLSSPENLPDTEKSEEEIKEDMQNASESLEKNKKKQAGEKQKSAAEKMQAMAADMKKSMESSSQEKAEEDLDALRALLENIIHLSFDQEGAMEELRQLNSLDPKYLEINRKQSQFKENSLVIQDSLFALSKRVPQLDNLVNKEISSLNNNMGKAIAAMAEQQTGQALTNQQYAMTSLNNLALLLDEALQQMQQQSANKMPGNANCNKPGDGKKPNSAKMESMQKAMAKQLDALKKAMKEGEKPGEKGKAGGMGGMSKELARIAAEQAAIREEIEKMSNELENGKDGVGKELKEIAKEMDKLEEEIAKKQISPELIKRQQDIMTRLLKAENAERERELDDKRESKSGKNSPKGNQSEYLEYKNRKLNELELIKTLPPDLKPYYKEKINTYFNHSKD